MRKLLLAALAASTVFGAAPALADDDYRDYRYDRRYDDRRYDDRYDDRRLSQRESYERAQERTRRAWARSGRRGEIETRRAWARAAGHDERGRYERRDERYAAYDREFVRFADRNRDGRISRYEYDWAIARF